MAISRRTDIERWEGEGGAPSVAPATSMRGTVSQIEWAERIKLRVNADFDRVAASFRLVAATQNTAKRASTEAILAILEDKRSEVMGRQEAGYFIHDWQDISDQVRQMIFHDDRYQAIKTNAASDRLSTDQQEQGTQGNMNVRPLHNRIVVKRIEEEETTRNGIVIPDSAKEKPQQADVLAVGHGNRLENGELVALEVKAGDRVLFGKYSGSEVTLDGTDYIILREDDVLAILDPADTKAK